MFEAAARESFQASGGAALSVKEVTGAPVCFVGVGETLDKFEDFRAEGMAQRMAAMQAAHYEPLQEAWSRHQAALRAVRQAHERLSEVDELSQLRGHAKVMSEAIQSVHEWQSAWAAVRAR